jgi:thiamine-phosphate pyrophosphorylase
MNREERINKIRAIDIYPVTCQEMSGGRTNLEILDAVMAAGAGIIQLREKNWTKKAIHDLALEFRKRTYRQQILLIINDHVDIALAVEADGVHLGQEDLPIAAARRISPGLIIGASSHNMAEALQAEKDGADYVNIGPIFTTSTKKDAVHFLGTGAIREIGPRLSVPYTTMGGIHIGNIHQVLETGARRVAMVTGINQSPDVVGRVRELRKIIRSEKAL